MHIWFRQMKRDNEKRVRVRIHFAVRHVVMVK